MAKTEQGVWGLKREETFIGSSWPCLGAEVSNDGQGRELWVRNISIFKEPMCLGEKTPGRA